MKVIIDTDPGIDDAMAILLAMADPRIDLIGLTTIFGNVPVETATRNALRLDEIAGHAVPVAAGAERPLIQAPLPHPDFVHGAEGFGNEPPSRPTAKADRRSAARFLTESCAAAPGKVTIIAVGPLTNLALALRHDPAITETAARVIVMGGAVETRGNVTPHAEANIWQDPHAAAEVLSAEWPLTLVGLDVTEKVRCGPADFASIAEAAPRAGGFLARAAEFYFDFHEKTQGFRGCFMHDPTAVIALTDPELFTTREAPLDVVLDGEEAGATRITETGRPASICLGVDAGAVREVFVSTLLNGRLP